MPGLSCSFDALMDGERAVHPLRAQRLVLRPRELTVGRRDLKDNALASKCFKEALNEGLGATRHTT
jgi:hypothetical protein